MRLGEKIAAADRHLNFNTDFPAKTLLRFQNLGKVSKLSEFTLNFYRKLLSFPAVMS